MQKTKKKNKDKSAKHVIPRTKVGRSSHSGFGIFAIDPIKKGDFIIEYIGKICTNKEIEDNLGMYLFELNNKFTIDGTTRKNKARYVNHSCRPNAESDVKGLRVFISAIKDIAPGEEVTYDYGKEFFNEFIKPKGCKCGFCDGKGKKLPLKKKKK